MATFGDDGRQKFEARLGGDGTMLRAGVLRLFVARQFYTGGCADCSAGGGSDDRCVWTDVIGAVGRKVLGQHDKKRQMKRIALFTHHVCGGCLGMVRDDDASQLNRTMPAVTGLGPRALPHAQRDLDHADWSVCDPIRPIKKRERHSNLSGAQTALKMTS